MSHFTPAILILQDWVPKQSVPNENALKLLN